MAYAREVLGLDGMDVQTALNVRDKSRMKTVLRAAGVPCARHQLVTNPAEALGFAEEVGFRWWQSLRRVPEAQATYRLDDATALHGWLEAIPPRADAPGLLEEFLVGEEHTFRQRHGRRPDRVFLDRRLPADAAGGPAPTMDSVDRACSRGSWMTRATTASGRSARPLYRPLAYATR